MSKFENLGKTDINFYSQPNMKDSKSHHAHPYNQKKAEQIEKQLSLDLSENWGHR